MINLWAATLSKDVLQSCCTLCVVTELSQQVSCRAAALTDGNVLSLSYHSTCSRASDGAVYKLGAGKVVTTSRCSFVFEINWVTCCSPQRGQQQKPQWLLVCSLAAIGPKLSLCHCVSDSIQEQSGAVQCVSCEGQVCTYMYVIPSRLDTKYIHVYQPPKARVIALPLLKPFLNGVGSDSIVVTVLQQCESRKEEGRNMTCACIVRHLTPTCRLCHLYKWRVALPKKNLDGSQLRVYNYKLTQVFFHEICQQSQHIIIHVHTCTYCLCTCFLVVVCWEVSCCFVQNERMYAKVHIFSGKFSAHHRLLDIIVQVRDLQLCAYQTLQQLYTMYVSLPWIHFINFIDMQTLQTNL